MCKITILGGPDKPNAETAPRNPREITRSPDGFTPQYYLKVKDKDKNPELYRQLKHLREKFLRLGRKTSLTCPKEPSKQYKALEVCLTRCPHKCEFINIKHLRGPVDDNADMYKDMLQYQHLANIIYGTMRAIDVFSEEGDSDDNS